MDDSVSKQLRKTILENGLAVLTDATRFEALLRGHCPQNRKEIAALMGAFREGVADSLRNALEPDAAQPSMTAMVKDLEENQGFTHAVAVWATEAWAYALGVNLPRPDAGSARQISVSDVASGQHPADAQKKRSKPRKVRVWPKLMAALGFTLAACGIVFWYFAPSASSGTAPQVEAAAGAGTSSLKATETPAPAIALATPSQASPNQATPPPLAVPQVMNEPAKEPSDRPMPLQPRRDLVGTAASVVHRPVEITIPRGTPLSIRLGEDIDSSAASPGDRFKSSVADNILVGDSVAIPSGAHAVIEVASVKKAGRLRGSSEIKLQLVAVVVHGETYPLTSQSYDLKAGSVGKIFEKGKGVSLSANQTLEFSLDDSVKISSR
jgi:hypothetical protein